MHCVSGVCMSALTIAHVALLNQSRLMKITICVLNFSSCGDSHCRVCDGVTWLAFLWPPISRPGLFVRQARRAFCAADHFTIVPDLDLKTEVASLTVLYKQKPFSLYLPEN